MMTAAKTINHDGHSRLITARNIKTGGINQEAEEAGEHVEARCHDREYSRSLLAERLTARHRERYSRAASPKPKKRDTKDTNIITEPHRRSP